MKQALVLLALTLSIACTSTSVVQPEPVPQPEPELEPAAPPLPAAPWSASSLARADVATNYATEWSKAENRETCAMIAPASVIAGAKARRANFYGGWAVAYDKAGSPGTHPSGERCEACGRGVFGVAGTGSDVTDGMITNSPHVIEWSDGSRAGYGGGYGGQWLASLQIRGQTCLYQVWTYRGREHLEELIASLRFVE